ncbi:2-hydroxyacid dehydrogenase [Methylorubrum extorquens]|uniref:2-hydroxyacid dehydrogenase n=1 Tax=Methylorubrum extorquens TaxID=408 RepID=UPI000158EFC1|nr:2-hydroxyacid dehydrogenase [Methylorubrum extorquens]ABY32718.1 D-isomer specific 2-hydroxyacid dehydrogenase NAD-binding [Methylorubrum extorquens PA1]KQP95582.1 hydroxyacid dehydrogenase [Methylobacterium sp. Leaf119]WIU39315.1 2-hydroxyacid dehydrogenase [Methylorubrum extorquens]
MDVTIFSTKAYDRRFLDEANAAAGEPHRLRYLEARLTHESAPLTQGARAVCAFVNDVLDRPVLGVLAASGTRMVALRSAGFNNVDLPAAVELGIAVGRVPAYSPDAVAEHTVALILALNRKTHRAYARVREGNFALEGLLGFDLKGRTVGIVGTGKIGRAVARILAGFGCRVLAYDPVPSAELAGFGAEAAGLDRLLAEADIVSLHCPLTRDTHHMIDRAALARMKRGVMLINTGRGALVDTAALIEGLKSGVIGDLGLDVYEEEGGLFFEDLSNQIIRDDVFSRLLTFPNVIVTGHQAFFTAEALAAIAATTIENLSCFEKQGVPRHPVSVERLA